MWQCYHPAGEPMSEEERSATVRKLLKKAAQTDGMSFEMFTNWFVKTNRQISKFRAFQVSSHSSDSHFWRSILTAVLLLLLHAAGLRPV